MWRRLVVTVAAAGIAAGAWAWWAPAHEREIRRLFDALSSEFNASAPEGIGSVARAVRLGRFFTEDAILDLGGGSAPLHGRETIVGIATRLERRTSAYRLRFEDMTVPELTGAEAQVSFTAVLRGRTDGTGPESLDAREFTASLRRVDGGWRIRRATAVATLR